jgi:hypothetical protein
VRRHDFEEPFILPPPPGDVRSARAWLLAYGAWWDAERSAAATRMSTLRRPVANDNAAFATPTATALDPTTE